MGNSTSNEDKGQSEKPTPSSNGVVVATNVRVTAPKQSNNEVEDLDFEQAMTLNEVKLTSLKASLESEMLETARTVAEATAERVLLDIFAEEDAAHIRQIGGWSTDAQGNVEVDAVVSLASSYVLAQADVFGKSRPPSISTGNGAADDIRSGSGDMPALEAAEETTLGPRLETLRPGTKYVININGNTYQATVKERISDNDGDEAGAVYMIEYHGTNGAIEEYVSRDRLMTGSRRDSEASDTTAMSVESSVRRMASDRSRSYAQGSIDSSDLKDGETKDEAKDNLVTKAEVRQEFKDYFQQRTERSEVPVHEEKCMLRAMTKKKFFDPITDTFRWGILSAHVAEECGIKLRRVGKKNYKNKLNRRWRNYMRHRFEKLTKFIKQ